MLKKMEYANWREICKEMGWKTIGGSYKDARLKYFESLCSYHKEGNKIIIDELFDEPKPVIDRRFGYEVSRLKKYDSLKIEEDEYNNMGIYKISLGNKLYIGSTALLGFRARFLSHYYGHDDSMKHTYELIQDGGVFEIVEDMTGQDESTIRMRENEYIENAKKDINYEVLNGCSGWGGRKFKSIKILSNNYDKAIELLKENGLIEEEV